MGASMPPNLEAKEPIPSSDPLALVGNSSMVYVRAPVKHTDIIILPTRKKKILAQVYAAMKIYFGHFLEISVT